VTRKIEEEGSRPLVSVVIPARNAARFIRSAIESVLAQTVTRVEILVAEDGSTDETVDIVSSYPASRVRLLSEPKGNLPRARNRGLAAAQADHVAFLEVDDYWLPNKLERQLPSFDDPGVVLVGCYMRWETPDGRVLGIGGTEFTPEKQRLVRSGRLMPFPTSSALFRTETVRGLGGFDESTGYASDLDMMARVAGVGSVACIPEVLGGYRVHGVSVSDSLFRDLQLHTRFVQARIAAQQAGGTLTLDEFARTHRPTLRERWATRSAGWFRSAAAAAAERRFGMAFKYGSLALISAPRYSLGRIWRERLRHRARYR
jgi:glycosyltransferase involved in cell wall biosynthesis